MAPGGRSAARTPRGRVDRAHICLSEQPIRCASSRLKRFSVSVVTLIGVKVSGGGARDPLSDFKRACPRRYPNCFVSQCFYPWLPRLPRSMRQGAFVSWTLRVYDCGAWSQTACFSMTWTVPARVFGSHV